MGLTQPCFAVLIGFLTKEVRETFRSHITSRGALKTARFLAAGHVFCRSYATLYCSEDYTGEDSVRSLGVAGNSYDFLQVDFAVCFTFLPSQCNLGVLSFLLTMHQAFFVITVES